MCQLHESKDCCLQSAAEVAKKRRQGESYVTSRRWAVIIIVQVKASAKGLRERERESRGIPFGQTVTFMLIYLPLGDSHTRGV